MPLPLPTLPRDELHARHIAMRGYRRADGLYDIEAHLVDTKNTPLSVNGGRRVEPGQPIHDMAIRVTVNDQLEVMDVAATIEAAPHRPCAAAADTLECLKGFRIGAGWTRAVRQQLSGAQGCTHLMELLSPLATVAFQTLFEVRNAREANIRGPDKPHKIDSCFAYASDREVVHRLWPAHARHPLLASHALLPASLSTHLSP